MMDKKKSLYKQQGTLAEWLTRCPAMHENVSLGISLGSVCSNHTGVVFLLLFNSPSNPSGSLVLAGGWGR